MPFTRHSSANTRSEALAVLSHGSAGPDQPFEPAASEPEGPFLVPFLFWLPHGAAASRQPDPPDPADLRAAIAAHLEGLGWLGAQSLRWAITAVDPLHGLQLEGVGVMDRRHPRPTRRPLAAPGESHP